MFVVGNLRYNVVCHAGSTSVGIVVDYLLVVSVSSARSSEWKTYRCHLTVRFLNGRPKGRENYIWRIWRRRKKFWNRRSLSRGSRRIFAPMVPILTRICRVLRSGFNQNMWPLRDRWLLPPFAHLVFLLLGMLAISRQRVPRSGTIYQRHRIRGPSWNNSMIFGLQTPN